MISIVIPAYNQEALIADAIKSCLKQNYEDKEILVIDDASTDNTAKVAKRFNVRVLVNSRNLGFAKNLSKCIRLSKGRYIVFLCGDDMFTNENVLQDVVDIFDMAPNVSVIDRGYYQYMDGHEGAVVEVREKNVLMSVINPSGVAIRRPSYYRIPEDIYSEVPTMIKGMLKSGTYKRLPYDSVKVRIHKNNLATKKSYYKGSAARNLYNLTGEFNWDFKSGYISLKNRVGNKYLLGEITENLKMDHGILLRPSFWFFALFSLLTPAWLLRRLSDFYRHRIGRLKSKIVYREHGTKVINIGAGTRGGSDTINIDVMPYPGIDKRMDMSKYPWIYEDESLDGIHAHHVIEHLPSQVDFINECLRVLKPGGFLYLALPHSSCVTSIGCMGHNRTYSYSTLHDYLSVDFYMFKKARFKTTLQKLNWWYGVMEDSVPWYFKMFIIPLNAIINFLIKLSPRFFENGWCYWVGGAREVIWRGEKL